MPYPFTTWVEEEAAAVADPRAKMPFANTWVDTRKDPDALMSLEEYARWLVGDGWLYQFVTGTAIIMCACLPILTAAVIASATKLSEPYVAQAILRIRCAGIRHRAQLRVSLFAYDAKGAAAMTSETRH